MNTHQCQDNQSPRWLCYLIQPLSIICYILLSIALFASFIIVILSLPFLLLIYVCYGILRYGSNVTWRNG